MPEKRFLIIYIYYAVTLVKIKYPRVALRIPYVINIFPLVMGIANSMRRQIFFNNLNF